MPSEISSLFEILYINLSNNNYKLKKIYNFTFNCVSWLNSRLPVDNEYRLELELKSVWRFEMSYQNYLRVHKHGRDLSARPKMEELKPLPPESQIFFDMIWWWSFHKPVASQLSCGMISNLFYHSTVQSQRRGSMRVCFWADPKDLICTLPKR